MLIRRFKASDRFDGFFQALEPLGDTDQSEISARFDAYERERAAQRLDLPKAFTFVAEDEGKVIGTATLILERKAIHNGGTAGHIEDVSVCSSAQGKGVGKALIQECIEQAKAEQCYKCVLNCSESNVAFYERCGFRRTPDAFMRIDL